MFMKRRQHRPALISRRRRPRRRNCGIVDFFSKVKIFKRSLSDSEVVSGSTATRTTYAVEGRGGDSSCEIHIDGDYLFVAIALLGAGLAYITYTAIQAGRRRKRSTAATVSDDVPQTGFRSPRAAIADGTLTTASVLLGILFTAP